LEECYKAYRNFYGHKYDFAITEIASSNPRSIRAHEKVGFENIHSYKGPDETEWIVVAWDWL
jgi:RimJ/RimL family protein N-acetyltransferase